MSKPFKETVEERAKRDPEFKKALEEEELKMSEIVHVYRGEYVSIDLVDDTTELTVENNIYSLTESMELQQDLARGIHKLVTGLLLLKEARSE